MHFNHQYRHIVCSPCSVAAAKFIFTLYCLTIIFLFLIPSIVRKCFIKQPLQHRCSWIEEACFTQNILFSLFSSNDCSFQTTRKGLSAIADLDNSRRTFHSSPRSSRVEQNSPTIRVRSFGNLDPSSPRSIPSVMLPSPGNFIRVWNRWKFLISHFISAS